MVFDPSLLPPTHQRLFTEAGITYEDSDDPPIAIAPGEFDVSLATLWVRAHDEPMMMRAVNGHWMLVFVGANGSVMIEAPAFYRTTDMQVAASRMRKWLDNQDLV